MSKRFTDSEKWKKPWFRKLSSRNKCFWVYVCDNCDIAGIWTVDFETAEYFIGEKIDPEEIKQVFEKQFIELNGGSRWFVKDFIEFQYGSLHDNNNFHRSILGTLEKAGVFEGLNSPSRGAKDKEKDKDKVKDKVKDKEKEKEVKKKHGEYKNILLSDSEFEKLGKEYPETYLEAIEFLSKAKEMKGYKYKSDYLALKKWVFDALKEHKAKHGGKSIMPEMQAVFDETMRRYGGKSDTQ